MYVSLSLFTSLFLCQLLFPWFRVKYSNTKECSFRCFVSLLCSAIHNTEFLPRHPCRPIGVAHSYHPFPKIVIAIAIRRNVRLNVLFSLLCLRAIHNTECLPRHPFRPIGVAHNYHPFPKIVDAPPRPAKRLVPASLPSQRASPIWVATLTK